jgi:hypothetical protein
MRLFARVGSRVDGQGTALDKTLVTALHVAIIGPLVGVDAIMAAEIRLAIERLSPEHIQSQSQRTNHGVPPGYASYLATMLPRAVEIASSAGSHLFPLAAGPRSLGRRSSGESGGGPRR